MEGLIKEDLGLTKLEGSGGYSRADKNVLICAFKPNRIAAVKRIVMENDPGAFVIVCDAKDVFGKGFMNFDNNGL